MRLSLNSINDIIQISFRLGTWTLNCGKVKKISKCYEITQGDNLLKPINSDIQIYWIILLTYGDSIIFTFPLLSHFHLELFNNFDRGFLSSHLKVGFSLGDRLDFF